MKFPKFIFKYYAFNLFNRDKWVKEQSLSIPEGSNVLDVGSGSAPYRDLFSHCIYKTHDFAQLNDVQLRGYKGYNKIDYVSDICSIPVPSQSFDYVLCTEVIEHVPEPISALKEISRIIKPGGVLFLTAPLGSGLHQEPYHFYGGYTPYFYNKVLTDCGFSKVEITSNMGFYSLFSQELIRLVRRLAPWKSLTNLMVFPFWMFFLILSIFMPFISPILDKLDANVDFTVGYHVKATM
jgi:ubiquinone/menaquinone biosynthesis C-methylase UbiE